MDNITLHNFFVSEASLEGRKFKGFVVDSPRKLKAWNFSHKRGYLVFGISGKALACE